MVWVWRPALGLNDLISKFDWIERQPRLASPRRQNDMLYVTSSCNIISWYAIPSSHPAPHNTKSSLCIVRVSKWGIDHYHHHSCIISIFNLTLWTFFSPLSEMFLRQLFSCWRDVFLWESFNKITSSYPETEASQRGQTGRRHRQGEVGQHQGGVDMLVLEAGGQMGTRSQNRINQSWSPNYICTVRSETSAGASSGHTQVTSHKSQVTAWHCTESQSSSVPVS